MVTKVLMPQLGEAVEEATITKWLKNEGDTVEEFEPLVEVNTDKVDTEIPSPVNGTILKILQPNEGSTIEVGKVIAWIGEPDESIHDEQSSQDSGAQPEIKETKSVLTKGKLEKSDSMSAKQMIEDGELDTKSTLGFISPVVAKIADEHGIDLQKVSGTGLKGRITKKDVLNYVEKKKSQIGQTHRVTEVPRPQKQDEIQPHTTIRTQIAEHMVMSKRTSPHVTTVFEADMSKIFAHKEVNSDGFIQKGAKLTLTAYFVAAVVQALKTCPLVNSSWRDDGVLLHQEINIGMATSLGEDGLIVPVIKNADDLSLLGIARCVNDLASRARSKKLEPHEVAGGTFTITNHGVSGSLFATPIINQPQCGILGVGKVQKRVIVLEDYTGYDTISIRPMVYLTLTFDHRILDGAIADNFLSKVVKSLESWS